MRHFRVKWAQNLGLKANKHKGRNTDFLSKIKL